MASQYLDKYTVYLFSSCDCGNRYVFYELVVIFIYV